MHIAVIIFSIIAFLLMLKRFNIAERIDDIFSALYARALWFALEDVINDKPGACVKLSLFTLVFLLPALLTVREVQAAAFVCEHTLKAVLDNSTVTFIGDKLLTTPAREQAAVTFFRVFGGMAGGTARIYGGAHTMDTVTSYLDTLGTPMPVPRVPRHIIHGSTPEFVDFVSTPPAERKFSSGQFIGKHASQKKTIYEIMAEPSYQDLSSKQKLRMQRSLKSHDIARAIKNIGVDPYAPPITSKKR